MLACVPIACRGRTLLDQGQDETQLERAVVLAFLTAGYVALVAISIHLLQFQDGVPGLWLPNVFAAAILLRNPTMPLPAGASAVFVASMVANLMVGADIGLCALYSLANAISVVASTSLIAKICGDRRSAISGAREYAIMFCCSAALRHRRSPLQCFWQPQGKCLAGR